MTLQVIDMGEWLERFKRGLVARDAKHRAGVNVCACGKDAPAGQTQERWGETWGLCEACREDREGGEE